MEQKQTLVINMLAGPGAGKTTCAWAVASDLKKAGYSAEYVSEYAKELVWDNRLDLLDGSRAHQEMLLDNQEHRLQRLVGKVDFIVTDSPIILNPLYLQEGSVAEKLAYTQEVLVRFSSYNNFCCFVERGRSFEQIGRIHNEQESRALDAELKDFLTSYNIYFGSYTYENIAKYIVPNCIRTFERINTPAREDANELSVGEQVLDDDDLEV